MGLDPGERRTGVALSDAEGRLASPLLVLTHSSREKALAAIAELANRHKVQSIVVGLPKNMDGTEGPQAARARRLAQRLRERLGLEVVLVDERLSTFAAEEALAHLRPARRRERLDAAAAAIILQGYLDTLAAGGSGARQ
ncbi:MAG: Holliday junction resolvase RuvX [Bacteroidetes bacterium]|nr:Holliday junction resolvase RuvX [Bacteroidota bacterium]MCL5026123.1 Holliday junction resolvase RuvX [Chloroflexota bacterium]